MLYLCEKNHGQIVHSSEWGCPLCKLRDHNNLVHDFIEQDYLQVKALVKFMNEKEQNNHE